MIRMFGAVCVALLVCGAVTIASPEVAEAQDAELLGDASLTDADSGSDAALVQADGEDKPEPPKRQEDIQAEKDANDEDVKFWVLVLEMELARAEKFQKYIKDVKKGQSVEDVLKKYGAPERPADEDGMDEWKKKMKEWWDGLTEAQQAEWNAARVRDVTLKRLEDKMETFEKSKSESEDELENSEEYKKWHCKQFPIVDEGEDEEEDEF